MSAEAAWFLIAGFLLVVVLSAVAAVYVRNRRAVAAHGDVPTTVDPGALLEKREEVAGAARWHRKDPSLGGIFLSYRREDAAPYARLLQFQLTERFPTARVFMDLDSIDAGMDFTEVIQEAVNSCAVLVALIGGQWVSIVDDEGGRRLDNPDDYVRFEVQTALERGVRVVPVLVNGAKPLRQEQLPSELQKLARLNALELSYGRYEYDAKRLLDVIQRWL